VEGCASLILDVNRAVRPVIEALGERRLRAHEVLEAGAIRLAWTRRGDTEPYAAVNLWLNLASDGGEASIDLDSPAGLYAGRQDERVALEATSCSAACAGGGSAQLGAGAR